MFPAKVFSLTSLHTNVKHQWNPPSGTAARFLSPFFKGDFFFAWTKIIGALNLSVGIVGIVGITYSVWSIFGCWDYAVWHWIWESSTPFFCNLLFGVSKLESHCCRRLWACFFGSPTTTRSWTERKHTVLERRWASKELIFRLPTPFLSESNAWIIWHQ